MPRETQPQGDRDQIVTADQLIRFMDGTIINEASELVSRVEDGVEFQLRLARVIDGGVKKQLAAALREVLSKEPDIENSPIVKKLEAFSRPQHKHTPLLDACLEADVPAYLYGEAGSGKSTAAENAAAIRGVNLRAISLSPTTSKADLIGYRDANGLYNGTGFREVYEKGGIFLFDEIDNGNPSSLALMNRALAGFENEFPDQVIERDWNTRIMAAANTIGKGATGLYVGRNAIDAATLDRFAMIPWDIDENLENELMKVITYGEPEKIRLDEDGIPTREQWLQEVRDFRTQAQEKGLRVVISSRSAIYGGKLAERGVGHRWLTELLIYKGMNETDRRKLR